MIYGLNTQAGRKGEWVICITGLQEASSDEKKENTISFLVYYEGSCIFTLNSGVVVYLPSETSVYG